MSYVWLEIKKMHIALVSTNYSKMHDSRSGSGGSFQKLFFFFEIMYTDETYFLGNKGFNLSCDLF